MESVSRRYSGVPFVCDDCGSPAHVSIAGGLDGHTMLCNDCAGDRGYPKGFLDESTEITARLSSITRHAFKTARWTMPDGTPRCATCGQPAGLCLTAAPKVAARADAPLLDPDEIEAMGGHVASVDYPELASILVERPDHIERKTAGMKDYETARESIDSGTGSFTWRHIVGPAIDRFEQRMPDAARPSSNAHSTDWCRFRRDSHCFFPKDLNEAATAQAGYPVWIPVDRGTCPRSNWETQKKCTMAEPGPSSRERYIQPDATVAWEDGGQRIPGRTSSIEKDAGWKDIQTKAKQIAANGYVRIISKAGDTVSAEVKGDSGTYLSTVTRVPGSKSIAIWSCGCPWAKYAWARSGRWKKLEGRMCAHALATVFTMQKREMFGGEITEDAETPDWRTEPLQVEQPKEMPGEWRMDRAAAVKAHLSELEWLRAGLLTDASLDPMQRLSWVEGISTCASVIRVEADLDEQMTFEAKTEGFMAKVRGVMRRVIKLYTDHTAEVEGIGRIPTSELDYSKWDPKANLTLTGAAQVVDDAPAVMFDLDVDDGNHIDCPNCGEHLHVMEDPSETGRCPSCEALYVRPKILQASLDADGDYTHAGLVIKSLDSGRVLMTQRTPYHNDEDETFGAWEFPGGSIEEGEDALQAALREFREETGLELPEGYRIDDSVPNGGYVAIHVSVPHETWTTSVELLPMETMGIGWFDPDHVQGELPTRPEIEETDWDIVAEAAMDEPGAEAILHDEPEGALPATDGGSDGIMADTQMDMPGMDADGAMDDPMATADGIHMLSAGEVIVPGDPRLAWLMDGAGSGPSIDDGDIAKAAAAWLAKTAVKDFSPAEQKMLIEEGASTGVRASNLDRLQLEGTHYEGLPDDEPDDLFL